MLRDTAASHFDINNPLETTLSRATTEFVASRIATETFLRSVDLLNELVDGDILDGLILNALWCVHLRNTTPPRESLILPHPWNETMSIHGLARAIGLPYPTVHRHLATLIRKGFAIRTATRRIEICPGLLESRIGENFRRRSIASNRRFIVGMQRIGMLKGDIQAFEREGALSEIQESVLFRANMEVVLLNLLLTARFYDDLVAGLVYKIVATQNVKHVNEVPPDVVDYFPDHLRRPISVYSAARALHMPYETTRRIANQFLEQGIFRHVGDQGVIVTAEAHRRMENAAGRMESARSIQASLEQIRHAGLSLSLLSF